MPGHLLWWVAGPGHVLPVATGGLLALRETLDPYAVSGRLSLALCSELVGTASVTCQG